MQWSRPGREDSRRMRPTKLRPAVSSTAGTSSRLPRFGSRTVRNSMGARSKLGMPAAKNAQRQLETSMIQPPMKKEKAKPMPELTDRQSGVKGKRVAIRGDLGARRTHKKQTKKSK